jgi:penicillin-binding protein 1A
MELTRAYAVFANGGTKVYPYLVTEVDDNEGKVLFQRKPPEDPERIVATHVNRDLLAMFYGVTTVGTGRGAAVPGHETGGKTGTTQDYHDAWFVGFTHDYVAAVWVGNDDSTPMKSVTGGSLPATIWKATMTVAEKGLPDTPLDRSPVQPPTDSGIFDSGDSYIPSGADDEAGGDRYIPSEQADGSDRDETRPPPGTPSDHKDFWDWLFNRKGKPAVPAEPDGAQSDTN